MCLEVNSKYIKKKNAKIGLKLHISAILWTFWLKSSLAKPGEHLDAECWRPRSENQSFTNLTAAAVGIPSLYIELLPGFGKLFHGNIPIRTNFYCHSCFMMRATHAGNLKSQLKKASRRFCSSNLGNCNYICFLGGEWGGLMCPKDTISPLIFSPSLGRSDSIQRRTN